jgi:hypothetical protein
MRKSSVGFSLGCVPHKLEGYAAEHAERSRLGHSNFLRKGDWPVAPTHETYYNVNVGFPMLLLSMTQGCRTLFWQPFARAPFGKLGIDRIKLVEARLAAVLDF